MLSESEIQKAASKLIREGANSGEISEFACNCGFSGMPGSFIQEDKNFICPICNRVVVTVDDIVQEVLRIDDEVKRQRSRMNEG